MPNNSMDVRRDSDSEAVSEITLFEAIAAAVYVYSVIRPRTCSLLKRTTTIKSARTAFCSNPKIQTQLNQHRELL